MLFYDTVDDGKIEIVVILAKSNGKYVLCRHNERTTYEIPGGHREAGESVFDAAVRELKEETGAVDFVLHPICPYAFFGRTRANEVDHEVFGMLFYAEVISFEQFESEIAECILSDSLKENWTYPEMQEEFMKEAEKRGFPYKLHLTHF